MRRESMIKILLELVNRVNIELLDSEAIHHSSGWRKIGWGYWRVQKRETTWRMIYDDNGITRVTVFFVISLTEVLFLRSLLASINLLCSAQHLIWIQIILQKQFYFLTGKKTLYCSHKYTTHKIKKNMKDLHSCLNFQQEKNTKTLWLSISYTSRTVPIFAALRSKENLQREGQTATILLILLKLNSSPFSSSSSFFFFFFFFSFFSFSFFGRDLLRFTEARNQRISFH